MMALDTKETMQRHCEASLCLQATGFPYILQQIGNPIEVFPEIKADITAHPGGNLAEPIHSLSSEYVDQSNDYYNKQIYQHDYYPWAAFYPDIQKIPYPVHAYENQLYHFPVEFPFQYAPFFTSAQVQQPSEFQFQDFQYFVVIDFEATCDKEKNPHPQEIIEFPSVIVSSATGQLEAYFQTYVRPTCNQLLTDFCKDLTGIQQKQVDRGITLSEAISKHDLWLDKKGIKNSKFAIVTWSNWDCRVMLESECRFKKIRKPAYFNQWINLRVPFREVFGGMRCNLKEAVEMAGLTWEGRAHCGLDDAKNTARLLALLMRRGIKFSITNSLMWQAPDSSITKQSPECIPSPYHQPYKPKDQPMTQLIQYNHHCFCGVKRAKAMVRKPGPTFGSTFYGCGNWTAAAGSRCNYHEWAST